MRPVRTAASFAALVLALAACGSGSSAGPNTVGAPPAPSSAAKMSTIAGRPANNHGTADVAGKSSVLIRAENFFFAPSVLKGSPGQKLTVHVVNATGTAHTFTVDAQHVNRDLDGHASIDATVTMPASGVLSFWCEYHKNLGMAGGLLVSGSVAQAPAGTSPSSSSSGGGYGGYGGYGGGG
jgi:plastocyanin